MYIAEVSALKSIALAIVLIAIVSFLGATTSYNPYAALIHVFFCVLIIVSVRVIVAKINSLHKKIDLLLQEPPYDKSKKQNMED